MQCLHTGAMNTWCESLWPCMSGCVIDNANTCVTCHVSGGPSGGNGGKGGNVWLEADISLNSLTSFRKQVHYRAVGGGHGGGSNMTGADGPDLTIKASILWLACAL